MKQQILNLKKKLLLVELPEEVKGIRLLSTGDISYEHSITGIIYTITLEYKVNKLIGKLTDITEEQFAEWLYGLPVMCIGTSKESFFSYLEANGIYFENQVGKKPHLGMFIEQKSNCVEDYNKAFKEWQEAQEKVWDIERCWILEII